MAISTSKKSLGKILAISLASAMAMSSLSAALVSVSAVQDPALASNGSVDFKSNDAEDEILALIGGPEATDNEIDTIVGNTFDLGADLNAQDYEAAIQYTDSDGLKKEIDVTKITYRISSGGSYAKINKDTLILSAEKAGTATLQVKVTGDVELGGDKSDKEVTFTHNITLNVHESAEIGLWTYKGSEKLSSDDLNNLAAYNSDPITFKLVSFHARDDGKFYADVKKNVQIGDDASATPTPTPSTPEENLAANAGATDALTSLVNSETGMFDGDAYDDLGNTTTVLNITSQEQAENVVNAVAAEKPAANSALTGLHVDEVSQGVAGASFDGKTAVLADEDVTTVKVYFSAADYDLPVPGAAAKLLEVDDTSEYTHYNKTTRELAKAASGADTVAIKVYKFKAASALSPIAITKGDVPKAEMAEIVNANKVENPGTPSTPDEPTTGTSARDKAVAAIKAVITAAKGDAQLSATLDADITAALTYDETNNTVSLTEAKWTELKGRNAIQGKAAVEGVDGYAITAEAFGTQKIAAVEYTEATVLEDMGKLTSITTPTNNTLTNNTLYKWVDNTNAQSPVTYYFAKPADMQDITTVVLTESIGEAGVTLDDVLERDTQEANKYWDETNGGLSSNSSGTTEVVVYKVIDSLTGQNQTDEVAYDADTWAAAIDAKITEIGAVKVEGATASDPATYYITKEVNDALDTPLTANAEVKDGAGGANDNVLFTLGANVTKVGATAAVPAKTFNDLFYTGSTEVQGKESLDAIIEAANTADAGTPVTLAAVDLGESSLKSVRFYAGSGAELFDLIAGEEDRASSVIGSQKWEKGTKSNANKGFGLDTLTEAAQMQLYTKGTTGTATVKAKVELVNGESEEYVLNVKIVKAADFGSSNLTVDKSGSKTLVSGGTLLAKAGTDLSEKSLSGYELRTAGNVAVEDGTIGAIDADGNVTVNGGRTGNIIEAEEVTVGGGATVGDIIDAGDSVTLTEGATAGKITTNIASDLGHEVVVTINDATVASIEAYDAAVDIKGGEINGSVTADKKIEITSVDEDEDGDLMDVVINGSVVSRGQGTAQIVIDNESDEGKANITIRGDVSARYANVDSDPSVQIGSSNTSGMITVSGTVQGEHIVLGGNGLVTLGAVNAVNEVEHTDEEGVVVDSKLEFQGFNAGIQSINKFADVVVSEGTVTVVNPLTTTTLDIQSDTQIVLSGMTVEDITGDGNIVVPAGELTVNGDVDDSPSLTLLGDVAVNTLAYRGSRGLTDKFDLGGLTVKAERQTDGTYNYTVSAQELYGIKTIGKNVTLGEGQSKTVTVVADAALPEGAEIVWESDDSEVASVEGNGTTATITGVDVGSVEVTAKIVDANGRELGYENATFTVDVLYADTVDVTGSDTPDDNELDLDTKKKNMTAGDTYTFMVRGNNDVDNISVTSGNTNVATVALANGADARGALYNITAVADGKTDITVTYQGKTSKIAVKVGGFQLDTTSKKMAPGQVYSVLAKNVPADQAGNVTLDYDSNIVDVVKVNDNYNGRGVLFNVTAKAIGDTEVKATYNNETESMAVSVVENTGKLTLDTASYTMPFAGTYTIGVKVEKNGRELSGEEVRAMITSGELVVTDSRTGSIVTTEVQANGNVRVTGRQREGTTYVQFIVMQNGQRVTHASVGVTVQNGATAGGSSVRSISQW